MMQLRPYQSEAVTAIRREWAEGKQRTLLVLPTGGGKTVVMSKVAEGAVREGGRVLIMAHRGELLTQAADKLRMVTGLESAIEKAESSSLGSMFPVTVGSVQSLCRERRLSRFPQDYFSTILVDEAHHCLADSYQHVLAHFPDANVLGVTATPDKLLKKQMGQYFDSLAYEYTMRQAIKDGYRSLLPSSQSCYYVLPCPCRDTLAPPLLLLWNNKKLYCDYIMSEHMFAICL